MDLDDSWSVQYSDHSGNLYRFWDSPDEASACFVYDPVRPETSSSGIYDGGEPQEGPVVSSQVEALFVWIRDLETGSSLRASSRKMGTGSFRVREGSGNERRFIIRASPHLKMFDNFLKPFRGSDGHAPGTG